jgi:Zn-dependent protease with chaperone function
MASHGPAPHFVPDYAHRPAETVPSVLLILALFGLLMEPLQNAISRRFERQSDRYALERTGRKEACLSAFRKPARLNKEDPQSPLARRAALPQPSARPGAPGDGGRSAGVSGRFVVPALAGNAPKPLPKVAATDGASR